MVSAEVNVWWRSPLPCGVASCAHMVAEVDKNRASCWSAVKDVEHNLEFNGETFAGSSATLTLLLDNLDGVRAFSTTQQQR